MFRWSVPPVFRGFALRATRLVMLSLAVLLAETPELQAQAAGSEFLVNTYTISTQRLPAVAAGGNGDFVVVWESDGQDGNPLHPGVFGQRFASAGVALGSEFQVNVATLLNQDRPKRCGDCRG